MESIAVKVLDPAGQHWAQLLNPLDVIRDLIPTLVHRLGLPTDLRYELIQQSSGEPLHVNETISEAGVTAGSSLVLRPIKDGLFAAFMEALYEEAIKFAAEQLWGKARASLETVYRLDPDYPDKQGLWKKIGTQAAKGVAGGVAAGTAVGAAGSAAGAMGAATAGGAASGGVAVTAGGGAAATGGSSTFGCLVTLLVGAVVCGCILIYINVIPAPDWLPDWFPQQGDPGTTVVDGVQVGTGDVRVTLTWDSSADIDLHVTDPAGEEIYYGHRQSASGGQLDVDANAGCSSDPQVENIFWPVGQAPSGPYAIEVDYFSACGAGPTTYEVTVSIDNRVVDTHSGTLNSSSDDHALPGFSR